MSKPQGEIPTKGESVIYLEEPNGNNEQLSEVQIRDRAAKEKVLLRKIDLRMMPLMMLICMFFSSLNILLPDTDYLFRCSQLLGSKQYCCGPIRLAREGPRYCGHSI